MSLVLGAYVTAPDRSAFTARWGKAIEWAKSSYPDLEFSETGEGALVLGQGITCPADAQEHSFPGWRGLTVGVAQGGLNGADQVADPSAALKAAEKLADRSGRFVETVWSEGAKEAYVFGDWLNWYPLFWAQTAEGMCFSSHLGLLLRLLEPRPPLDPVGVAELLMLGHQFAGRTPFVGVSLLNIGERLDLHTGRLDRKDACLPFSTSGFGRLPNTLQDRFHDALMDSVREYIAAYDRVLLPLSGGMDSRLIGACLQKLGADFTAATYSWYSRADRITGRRVGRALGCGHKSVSVSVEDVVSCVDFVARMLCGTVDVHGAYVEGFCRHLDLTSRPTILLAGTCGDGFEGAFLPKVDGSSEEIHDFVFRRRRRALWSDEEVREIGQRIGLSLNPRAVYDESWRVFQSKEILPFQQCTWWEWQGTIRRYVTHQNRTCDLHVALGTPYVNRRICQELLSWPRSMLTDRRGVKDMLIDHYPHLAKIPAVKAQGRAMVQTTVWGAIMEAVACRLPQRLWPIAPVCFGGGRPDDRKWCRLLELLMAEDPAWLKEGWSDLIRKNSAAPIRVFSLASLLHLLHTG